MYFSVVRLPCRTALCQITNADILLQCALPSSSQSSTQSLIIELYCGTRSEYFQFVRQKGKAL